MLTRGVPVPDTSIVVTAWEDAYSWLSPVDDRLFMLELDSIISQDLMDETLPDDKAITVPVPAVDLTVENRFQALNVADISHFVVQYSCAGPNYDFDKPWPFWFFIGKTLSKAFLGNEDQLEWFNAVRVRDREFITLTNVGRENSLDSREMNHDLDEKRDPGIEDERSKAQHQEGDPASAV
ncbi:hypothetical protein BDQ94DRAFT_160744 [Aspergillus welwitschiae]|uniref:Uncharacterized protein n=1 Tax=Aspergillus welwitschiae TaxID=1341132 RepID=A0A3F3PW92_9EURO|nr:hypothetical protein BDQ94DRAFT_160744 [Aspergillus welwitschiae]RDH31153.1 hypothetical protein BDQ94DRAFT_160744 [Aspergillus welwitschiae]